MESLTAAYLATGAALGSAIIVGTISLFNVKLTNKANIERAKLEFERGKSEKEAVLKRERGEQLYSTVDNWFSEFAHHYLVLAPVMQNKYDYNKYLDIFLESGNKSKVDYGRIKMILDIYFPELLGDYQRTIELRNEINDVQFEFKKTYQERGRHVNNEALSKYTKYSVELEKWGGVFKKNISKCVRNI